MPLVGSPVINAGDPAFAGAPTTDQRGLARVAQSRIDLGSVEYAPPAPPPPRCDLNSFDPKRVLDTRNGIGGPAGKLGTGETKTVQISGVEGIPTTGVKAVIVNITAARSSAASFITAWPSDKTRPANSSNVNAEPGQDVPNLAFLELSADGKLSVFNSAGQTDIIIDVMGYFGTCATYTPVATARLLDTRDGTGAPVGKVGPGSVTPVAINGNSGLPATGIDAVVVNVTSTGATNASYITAWPSGTTRPDASTLNTEPGVDVPNLAVVKVGADGLINLFNEAGSTHLLVDVVGYFPTDTPLLWQAKAVSSANLAPAAVSAFVPINPRRILDSRRGLGFNGPAAAGTTNAVQITGTGSPVPVGARAVIINLTSTASSTPGFVTLWANGLPLPATSNLNTEPGVNVANLVVSSLSADGKISVFNSHGTTHLVGDIVGYFPADTV